MCITLKRFCKIYIAAIVLTLLSAESAVAEACETSHGLFCFLSEFARDATEACDALPGFLENQLDSGDANGIFTGTLVIDIACTLDEPLILPRRMTLAGLGIAGEGALSFPNLAKNEAAISIQDPVNSEYTASVTIRDLGIYGPAAQPKGGELFGIGLELVNDDHVILERVRITGFGAGVRGLNSLYTGIYSSNISDNDYNLVLLPTSNSWRIRDSILSRAARWSVYVSSSNDVLIDGNRFESNTQGGIQVNAVEGALISNNRFESNGVTVQFEGIQIWPTATHTRVLTNYFSTSTVSDYGFNTQCAFNVKAVGNPLPC